MKHYSSATIHKVHNFVEQNFNGLRHAARQLGGEDGVSLVDDIAVALSREAGLSRRTAKLLHRLRRLLSLENVHDDEGPEAAFFAMIDPASPIVEDICLLSDGLAEVLDSVTSRKLTGIRKSLQAA